MKIPSTIQEYLMLHSKTKRSISWAVRSYNDNYEMTRWRKYQENNNNKNNILKETPIRNKTITLRKRNELLTETSTQPLYFMERGRGEV